MGNKSGKWSRHEDTKIKMFYAKYERIVEKENKQREQNLKKIRFELILNRTDISRQRKQQICKSIVERVNRNRTLESFEKLLHKQSKLKIVGGKIWLEYEQKLQELIKVL